MEIIKEGTLPNDRIFEGHCTNCKSILRFKQSEGEITYSQMDGDFITVKCPICGHRIHTDL